MFGKLLYNKLKVTQFTVKREEKVMSRMWSSAKIRFYLSIYFASKYCRRVHEYVHWWPSLSFRLSNSHDVTIPD